MSAERYHSDLDPANEDLFIFLKIILWEICYLKKKKKSINNYLFENFHSLGDIKNLLQ